MSKIKEKGVSAIIALAAAAVALIGLVLYGVYIGNGGTTNALALCAIFVGILLEVSLLVLNGDISDVAAILAPVLLVSGAMMEVGDGIGNLTDYLSGIICFGNPDLAPSNIAITAVLMVSVVIAIAVSFMRREKNQ